MVMAVCGPDGREEEEAAAQRGGRAEGGGGDAGAGSCRHRFLDRSKVRILLCDNDPRSSQEVLQLLSKCSYQVTSVRSARQVIDALNAQGPEIDIILTEVDLPLAKGLKMLKYLTRDKELRRIPIIMMSCRDEVSVVVKCLRLGAADYLVKPLRTNELLNLWTHMWRRRRMLGLSDKDVFSHDLEPVLSEPSDANTNSTTLLSVDTDDKLKRATNLETSVSNHRQFTSNASAVEPVENNSLDGDRAGAPFSCPRKTDLKVGESSAFLTYVRSSAPTNSTPPRYVDENGAPPKPSNHRENLNVGGDNERCKNRVPQESCSDGNDVANGENIRNMNASQVPLEFPIACFSSSPTQPQSRNGGQIDVSGVPSIFPVPFYYPRVMEQNMIHSSVPMFQGNLNDVRAHTAPAMLPQYDFLPHCSHMPLMPAYSYHPVGIGLQSNQMPASHAWPSMTGSSTPEVKSGHIGRREAALIKFRQKRKDRCFDKKIRYVNRKRLAEKRPRVRGQFVRQVNSMDVHQNGYVAGDGNSEEDEDAETMSRELELTSSQEQNASDC